MIKRSRDHGAKREDDDVQQLLHEWKRQIRKEKVAAKQHRLLNASTAVHPASLDELTAVTRIGRLRLLRKLGRSG